MQDPYILQMTASEPLSLKEEVSMMYDWYEDVGKLTFIITDRTTRNETSDLAGMAGDINIFFNDMDDKNTVEIDVMVAEHKHRRKGLASQAVLTMMRVVREHLGVQRFRAKIKLHNEPSMRLFRSLGFVEETRVEVFNEVHLIHVAGSPKSPPQGNHAVEVVQAQESVPPTSATESK